MIDSQEQAKKARISRIQKLCQLGPYDEGTAARVHFVPPTGLKRLEEQNGQQEVISDDR